MDFIYKNRRLIVVFLAIVLIMMGVVQMITGKALNSEVTRWVEYIVMFGALYLLLVLPKKYNAKAETGEKENNTIEEDVAEAAVNDEQEQEDK